MRRVLKKGLLLFIVATVLLFEGRCHAKIIRHGHETKGGVGTQKEPNSFDKSVKHSDVEGTSRVLDTSSSTKTKAGSDRLKQTDIYTSQNFTYPNGAVAADHHKCSVIGRNVLEKGGSAVDAAIATHFCVEIMNSHSTGIGGGGFLTAYNKKKGEFITIDFRETLPKAFVPSKNMTQGDTILVPGVLKGLDLAHKKMGKLPWKDLFKETIKLAEEGFLVHEALAIAIAKKKDFVLTNLGLREIFAPNGYLVKRGHRLKRKKYAETLKKIADSGGSDIFYKGEFALDIVNDVREAGGSISLEDLRNYRAIVRKPIKTRVGNLTLYGPPTPSSATIVALMLKIMTKFNWTEKSLTETPGLFYHQVVEAMKFSSAPGTLLGDPEYASETDKITQYMLSDETAEKMFAKIDNRSHLAKYYGPFSAQQIKHDGTSHISVVGPEGDACSITSSINAYFGSKVVSRKLGFIYNNELSDFSEFWPEVYNYNKDVKIPGKRPMSKVSPIIMVDDNGEVQVCIGAAGGFFIPSSLGMTLANYLLLKDNITTAVARPRLHCQLFPPTVVYEETMPATIAPLLNQYHHAFVTNDSYAVSGQAHAIMGVIQAVVRRSDGKLEAVCDYRKGGLPAGL